MARRRLFTTEQFYEDGGTRSKLRWLLRSGGCVKVCGAVYAEGAADPTPFEQSLGHLMARKGPAWGMVAGQLHEFDGIDIHTVHVERTKREMVDDAIWVIDGYWCTSPLQTLVDLAFLVDDDVWEQALESALFRKLVELDDIAAWVPAMSKMRYHGVGRIRRVLEQRPLGAAPTESLLETLMVQVARLVPGLPPPVRQYVLTDDDRFVARIDLCWPELGLFMELDGEGHLGQPVYDASRETDIVATAGWLCGRFSWTEVRHHPQATAARLGRLVEQARRRPVAAL